MTEQPYACYYTISLFCSSAGVLQAGFIEQPEVVDFTVTVMGGATLAGLIPSLKAWLVRFARDAILSHYVLPEQWCFRLDPVSLEPFQWLFTAAAAVATAPFADAVNATAFNAAAFNAAAFNAAACAALGMSDFEAAGCLQKVEDINVPDGMLSVTVIEAKNIPKGDYLSDSDPYIA